MGMKKLRVYVDEVAVDVFYDKKINFETCQQAAVILPGFPDFIGASAMTNYQVSLGNIVFQPHMRGTFDSAGRFSPFSVKESFRALNKLITEAKGSKVPNGKIERMSWKIDSVVLIGHSFGGILVLRYFYEIMNVKSIIFTSPALHYAAQYGCKEIGPEHYKEVGERYPFTYRLSPIAAWKEILEGTEKLPDHSLGKVEKVIAIYGREDKYFDIESVEKTVEKLIKSYITMNTFSLYIAEHVGHPVAELLSDNYVKTLVENFCKR